MTDEEQKGKDKKKDKMDVKSTPSYSSDFLLSVFQNRPNRGALICSKICSKSGILTKMEKEKQENQRHTDKKGWKKLKRQQTKN